MAQPVENLSDTCKPTLNPNYHNIRTQTRLFCISMRLGALHVTRQCDDQRGGSEMGVTSVERKKSIINLISNFFIIKQFLPSFFCRLSSMHVSALRRPISATSRTIKLLRFVGKMQCNVCPCVCLVDGPLKNG